MWRWLLKSQRMKTGMNKIKFYEKKRVKRNLKMIVIFYTLLVFDFLQEAHKLTKRNNGALD